MADVHKKGLNAELIERDLENCCRGEGLCGQCQGKLCTIGFAKQCIQDYKETPKKEVSGGSSHISKYLTRRNWKQRLRIFLRSAKTVRRIIQRIVLLM